MFENLEMAPPDAILGLTDAFKADQSPHKINLGVGVYKDEQNATPILESVKRAEERLLDVESTKSYLGIPGSPAYGACVRTLLFGSDHEIVSSERAKTAQTPGGTGALRVAADFIHTKFPKASIWLSSPTWANHNAIFASAGITVNQYPYYDAANKCLDFDAMKAALAGVPAGDVVLFHGCCHNPSGMDPDSEQWAAFAALTAERGILPLFDFAYQGFGAGLEEDAAGLRQFCTSGRELLVCSSFSKNFGLYNERVGALTLVGSDAKACASAFSHVEKAIRSNYSNPPSHGGSIVTTVLSDSELRAQWVAELAAMRERIRGMREDFVATLKAKGVAQDFSFIAAQNGMFSFSGLSPEQVKTLREKHAIYIVGSGRINVAGMTPENMDPLCEAIAGVL
jgi:aspartate/tyrosine/aromatic aminotransferase